MRLHLIILRHGLPVTRILWTTNSPPLSYASGPGAPYGAPAASSSAITSTRFPNTAYGNGGYTIAQLLEDVNEVVPLETDGKAAGENDEFGGQWGLEDYVVEVGGFECLHFMEVEGLLRDGDEVVIRPLQTADLRARRISGRHQISADGRHLIDGVPFGRPYLKRSYSSRPAIRIPPRKRRRTTLSGWNEGLHEDDDADWPPPGRYDSNTGREPAMLDEASIHSDQGTIIRHPTSNFDDGQGSDSDADTSEIEDEDLSEELKGLREDLDAEALEAADSQSLRVTRSSGRVSRLRHRDAAQAAVDASPARSSVSASHPRSDSVVGAEPSPKSKNVRFKKVSDSEDSFVSDESPESEEESTSEVESSAEEAESTEEEAESSVSSDATSSVSSDTSSVSDSDSESESESESESVSESESESEPEMAPTAVEPKVQRKFNPPGKGSLKTKKSNRRNKLRRKLAKLKELGYLPPNANFADLRAWEAKNGEGPLTEVKDHGEIQSSQAREQSEFEARRQQLLRQLESGGIDVDAHFEKENFPPKRSQRELGDNAETEVATDAPNATVEEAPATAKRRKLDVASSKRLLFGSLGVKTPRSKADEEATRQKLAAPVKPQTLPQKDVEQRADEGAESDLEENWQEKLVLRATECVYDDINLGPPSFPFKQRWDAEARELIRQRRNNGNGNGNGRKNRKRKNRDWQEEGWYDGGNEDQANGDVQLDYGDQQVTGASEDIAGDQVPPPTEDTDDLPLLPDDLASVPDLVVDEVAEGAIIAFKQLDMSKATNWQPKVSEYRVAQVESVADDGTLSLRLAKRDRERREPIENEDGTREYSGFEMPGFEDEVTEDDGFRTVSFGELIEPKLLQPAERASSAQVEVNGKDANLPDREDASAANDGRRAPVEAITLSGDVELPAISTQTRNEISQMIRDAGFRSTLNSELQEPDFLNSRVIQAESRQENVAEEEGEPSPIVRSPAFTGFASSPPEVESTRPGVDGDSEAPPEGSPTNDGEVVQEDPVESPTSYQIPRSSRSEDAAGDAQPADYPQLPGMSDQPEEDGARSTSSHLDGTAENLSDGEQAGSSSKGPSPSAAEEPAEVPAEEEPATELTSPRVDAVRDIHSSNSAASSTVPNPFYYKDRAYEERFEKAAAESQGSETLEETLVATESSFDLPSVDTLFRSTAPARSTRKQDSPAPKSKRNAFSSPRQRSSSPAPAVDEEEPRRSPLKPRVVVDLTLSSPPESPGGSDDDFAKSQGLPKGPGWVQKNFPATRRRTRASTGTNGLDLEESGRSPSRRRRAGLRRSR
ncbi:hypothetical protein VTN77DRAFT_984 [Rasamsonia byssochlamydoides]|uniref:uncharacterized protein n=1 Tax=Rasamsonia byssochlamydoides TaxID=89139 RepID=UPI0037445305